MWSALRHVGASMRTVAEGVQLSDMELMHYDMKAEGDNTLNVPHGFSLEYGDAFVSNLVKHVSLTGSRLHAKAALSPNLTLRNVVPSVYLIPDFFYPTAAETNINYGTLGVRMAEMMFNHSVPVDRLARHKACFKRYGMRLGLNMSDGDIHRALRARYEWFVRCLTKCEK
ncbi:uncharacterized protein LOC142774474 [Rhipicephalus microplus]|uniref:uncharacterized protein LOC142774474 n=1 Tax=Rhipicephalus microplus TaxID=6941 RepID=UPI003F6BC322